MKRSVAQLKRTHSHGIAFLVGVPAITLVYTGCLILARGADWQADSNSFIDRSLQFQTLLFFKPAHHLSFVLPHVAEWQHALGIVLIVGALWGVLFVSVGICVVHIVKNRKQITQPEK